MGDCVVMTVLKVQPLEVKEKKIQVIVELPPDLHNEQDIKKMNWFDKLYPHVLFLQNLVSDSLEWNREDQALVFHCNIIHEDFNSVSALSASLFSAANQFIQGGGDQSASKGPTSPDWGEGQDSDMEVEYNPDEIQDCDLILKFPWFVLNYTVIDANTPYIILDPQNGDLNTYDHTLILLEYKVSEQVWVKVLGKVDTPSLCKIIQIGTEKYDAIKDRYFELNEEANDRYTIDV
jgi:hypothetical protein